MERLLRPAKFDLACTKCWTVNPANCGIDNGRVLGYDNSHGRHHRHFVGQQERVSFSGTRHWPPGSVRRRRM